jgi:hypothetical protein
MPVWRLLMEEPMGALMRLIGLNSRGMEIE